MKTLQSMTPVDRIEEILQLCHGLTIEELQSAIGAYRITKTNPFSVGLEPLKKFLALIREDCKA